MSSSRVVDSQGRQVNRPIRSRMRCLTTLVGVVAVLACGGPTEPSLRQVIGEYTLTAYNQQPLPATCSCGSSVLRPAVVSGSLVVRPDGTFSYSYDLEYGPYLSDTAFASTERVEGRVILGRAFQELGVAVIPLTLISTPPSHPDTATGRWYEGIATATFWNGRGHFTFERM